MRQLPKAMFGSLEGSGREDLKIKEDFGRIGL